MEMQPLRPFLNQLSGFLFEPSYTQPIEGANFEIVEWKKVLEKITGELKKSPLLLMQLESVNDEMSYLGLIFSNVIVKKILGEYVSKCKHQIEVGTAGKKNSIKATSIRLQSNKLFAKKQYLNAYKMYTRALMFAKDDDEEVALLFANRSACYFHLDQFENALEDIERAFKFGYDKVKPPGKLLIRRGLCFIRLGRVSEVKELLDNYLQTNGESNGTIDSALWQQLQKDSANVNRKIIKRDITMSQFQDLETVSAALNTEEVFCPHERFPWLNAKVDLRYDGEKGYHLVSNKEMKYGEIVALSKPFASLDPKRNSYDRCHFCMMPCFESTGRFSDQSKLDHEPKISPDSIRMVTPLPCTECSNVLYCSDRCRTKAWTAFHRFECNQMTVLSKMDCKFHLALRIIYMMGTLDVNSPIQKMIRQWDTIADPLELMVDQEAYSFIHKNPLPERASSEKKLESVLTLCFHLKLLQMSDLLTVPNNIDDQGYLHRAANVCLLQLNHLYQAEINMTVPFSDLLLESTITPSPAILVDGLASLMKHSCEATVASSSLLSESLSSNVKLLYATGGIPAGTQLTLAYNTEEPPSLEHLEWRKYRLILRFGFECFCTRCVREIRDCLDITQGVYYPIACSVCGELMVRSQAGGSYRCSSTDGCSFKYSVQEMKTNYKRVEKIMALKRGLFGEGQIIMTSTRTLQPNVTKFKAAIESTSKLLYGRSIFLAQLYGQLAQCYMVLLMTTSPAGFNYVYSSHLPASLLYIGKALDVLEAADKGPCANNSPIAVRVMEQLLPMTQGAVSIFSSRENEQEVAELVPSLVQAKDRIEAFLKMTAYDAMVASSLSAQN